MNITAVVLAFNEELHLDRCLASLEGLAGVLAVVDSGSTDRTVGLAEARGARVFHHPFRNYSTQFNWALEQLDPSTEWVLRIDADEVLTPNLRRSIAAILPTIGEDVHGITFRRRIVFQGREIRHGGVGGVQQLRLFRFGLGHCEQRWMDEHIKVEGRVAHLDGDLIDDNLNSLTWWTEKHNRYASREAVDLLNLEFGFLPQDSVSDYPTRSQAGAKRWFKEKVYANLPGGLRAFAYFAYRYVVKLGFLDGRIGTSFHVLQGFWYRYLVDQKVAEVKRHMARTGSTAPDAIKAVLNIDVR
jgi:glycosyltransferase involved in cell wall biosynthesis